MQSLRRGATAILATLALACAAGGGPSAPSAPAPSAAPYEATATIEIVPPAKPLPVAAVVRPGSFARSHASPTGVSGRFARVLGSARVFSSVLDAPGSAPSWELVVTAADYGEPNAYTFELSVLVLRGTAFVSSYTSKQSTRQTGKSQLTVGPEQLGELAERAIRDAVRQIAADTERLSAL
jgi:hypothetical protein